MTATAQRRVRISILVLLVSADAWAMLLVSHMSTMSHAHHLMPDSGASPASPQMLLAMKPVVALMVGWALMLVAMMSPTLIAPVCHIVERSFKRRQARSVALFVTGYAAIWLAAGVVLMATAHVLGRLVPQDYLAAIGMAIIAFVWQCSPAKQRCLNRNHNHRELAAFGTAADLDVLRFGITHGYWCVGSCWALMLLPMVISYGHFAVMAVITFVMISERLEHPQPLGWRIQPRAKLVRIVVAQTQIRMRRALSQKAY